MLESSEDDILADAIYEYLREHSIFELLKVVTMVVEAKELAEAGA